MRRSSRDMKLEVLRKATHVGVGLFIILLFTVGVLDVPILGLFLILFSAVVLYNIKYEKELLTKILALNRPDRDVPGLDALSFILGCWIVLLLLDRNLAFAAIMILSFGDPIAHLISRGFGGINVIVTKSSYIWGTLAGTLAGALAAWVYVPFIWALIASAFAMFVEAGELRISDHHVDDNLTIPIVSGFVLWVISFVFA